LLALLEAMRPTVTAPGFSKLRALVIGWVRTTGRHAVTEALVASGISGRVDHEGFHRFFSRGAWEPDAWGQALLRLMLRLIPEGEPLRIVLDDTLAAHNRRCSGSAPTSMRSARHDSIVSSGLVTSG
jgi:hypothetical protein